VSALATFPTSTSGPTLDEVLRAMNCIVWRVSLPSMTNLHVSANTAELLGYSAEAWRDPDHWGRIVHPDDRAEVEALTQAMVERGEPFEREYRVVRPDGRALWLHDSVAFTRDAHGVPVEMHGIALDVTARRTREDALRYDGERRKLAMQLARVAAWEWHADTDRIVTDPEGLSMLGRGWTGVTGLEGFLGRIHPDDRERVAALAKAAIVDGHEYRADFRVLDADGGVRHFESRGVWRGIGASRTLVGASRDVTEAQRALNEAQLRSLLLDSLGEGVSVARQDGTLLYVNAALERMFGYAPGELVGRCISSLSSRSPEDYARRADEMLAAVLAHGRWSGPMTSRRKDGTPLQTYGTITRTVVDGEPLWITIRQDMTERHRVQRDVLDASHREQEALAHELHESIAQQLTGTALLAGALRDESVRQASPLSGDVARLNDLLLEAVGMCRRLAQGVPGFSLMRGGLELGLRELAHEFEQRHGRRCELRVDRTLSGAMRPETARHLYWIAEDALAVVGREGTTTDARLRLERRGGAVWLSVQFPGITPERFEALGGAELRIIGYRAALLGAGVATVPGDAGGVSMDCLCPMDGKAE
jgi:PAS domain S-box-containing protein